MREEGRREGKGSDGTSVGQLSACNMHHNDRTIDTR